MVTQAGLWWATLGALLVALGTGVAEWLRTRRRNLDRVGWMPWTTIQILALFATAILAVLALKSG
jgi:hypothetical protein